MIRIFPDISSMQSETLTGTGTWSNPGVTAVFLVISGAGGGGGGGLSANIASTIYGASGGGAGEVFMGWVPVSGNVSYGVGAGGTGGQCDNNGIDGGDSYFGDIYAQGGGKGYAGSTSSMLIFAGEGGGVHNGGPRLEGQDGTIPGAGTSTSAAGGDGGHSGITGIGGGAGGASNNVQGGAGADPGAGGGGGYSYDASATNASEGGNGADGCIYVFW